ncbi:hypothetical protein ABS71_02900 [bacterium SCN 62-11]|nr:MAG: hypothetical protein ABS71_02900 [bacterium SCN 62-11]
MKGETLRWQDLELDSIGRRLLLAGGSLKLTPTQTELLAYLLRRPRQVITRAELRGQVPHMAASASDYTLDRHMSGLRARLRECGKNIIIQTIRGEGYMLSNPQNVI